MKRFILFFASVCVLFSINGIAQTTVILDVPFFSQVDPQWKDDTLGPGPYTIGSDGCTMTSAAMVIAMFGFDVTPQTYNIWLTNNTGYSTGSLFYWSKISGYTNQIVRDAGPSGTIIDEINRGYPVIAETDYFEQHWVVIIGYVDNGQSITYYINDPLRSAGPTSLSYNLTGDYHYVIAPVPGGYNNGWNPNPSQVILDRYIASRNAGNPLGIADDNGGTQYVHDWSGITIQDFYGDNTGFYDGHTAIVLNSTGTEAFLLKEGFRDMYLNLPDKTNGQYFAPTDLGAPTTDEVTTNPSAIVDGNTYQYFDHGYLKYIPHTNPGTPGTVEVYINGNHVASSTALVTIAGSNGGTGGSSNSLSISNWQIPTQGIQGIPYTYSITLKNLATDATTYESIRLRAQHQSSTQTQSWEWNDQTVSSNGYWTKSVQSALPDTGNWMFKVVGTNNGQTWQLGAITPEVQEKTIHIVQGNPATYHNPDVVEVVQTSLVISKPVFTSTATVDSIVYIPTTTRDIPLQTSTTKAQAILVSTSSDTTYQHIHFEIEKYAQRFTIFGDTDVVIAPYDTITIVAPMDSMYNLGSHKLYVCAKNHIPGTGYTDIATVNNTTGINPYGFTVFQPTVMDSLFVKTMHLVDVNGNAIAQEHEPEERIYVHTTLVSLYPDEVINLTSTNTPVPLTLDLYDGFGYKVQSTGLQTTIQTTPTTITDSLKLQTSNGVELPNTIGRYELILAFDGEKVKKVPHTSSSNQTQQNLWGYPYTITIAYPYEVPLARTDTAAFFDGYADRVSANSSNLTGNQYTFEGRIYLTQHSTGALLSKWANEHNNPVFELGITPTSVYCLINGEYDKAEFQTTLELEKWYHVAATYNGSNGITLFLNGESVAHKSGNCGHLDSWNSTYPIYMGARDDNMFYYNHAGIKGYLDEVRIWKKVRSQKQIQATMNSGLGNAYTATSDSQLVGYWSFDTDMADHSYQHRSGGASGDVVLSEVVVEGMTVPVIPANSDTVRIYAQPNDVVLSDGSYGSHYSWSYHRDMQTGDMEASTSPTARVGITQFNGPAWGTIDRYALSFDISAIPDSAVVLDAKLHFTPLDYRNSQGSNHTLSVVQLTASNANSNNPNELFIPDDYGNFGDTAGSSTYAYDKIQFQLKLNSANAIALNDSGKSWIATGIANTTNTNILTLGLRQGNDVYNQAVNESPNAWGFGSYVTIASADYPEEAKRPYLEVVYTFDHAYVPTPPEPDIVTHPTLVSELISYWEMNEESGTRYDAHANKHLTSYNNPSTTTGIIANATSFNSSQKQRLGRGGWSEIHGEQSFTISTWYKSQNSSGQQSLVSLTNDPEKNHRIILGLTGGRVRVHVLSVPYTVTGFAFATGPNLADGQWHMITYTDIGNRAKIYVDGVLIYQQNHTSYYFDRSFDLRFGSEKNGWYAQEKNYLTGSMDNVGIWRRVLTDDEVLDLYNNGNGLAYDAQAGLHKKNSLPDAETVTASTIPTVYALHQNYPNPFNPVTTIAFDLPEDNHVTISIYDILGREVATITNNKFYKAGSYTLDWNAVKHASGVYFYTLKTNNHFQTKKMLLMK